MTADDLHTRAGAVTTWGRRADVAHHSLAALWGASWPQLLHNAHPAGDDASFNYWWLAHVVDCHVDAYERTGDPRWLDAARRTAANVVERNGASLFNDYFDDMLWFGLALLRTSDAGEPGAEADAAAADAATIWAHVLEHGANDRHGWSVSWRRQQPGYKNTPANGPFAILGARLARRTGDARYLHAAVAVVRWLDDHLVSDDGFVWDGLGREGGDAVDVDWRFTYNPGLYVGACVELFRSTGEQRWLDAASRVARTSVRELARDGVFLRENRHPRPDTDGTDVGLFKGIWFRYAAQLLAERDEPEVARVVRTSTDALWEHARLPLHEVTPAADGPGLDALRALTDPGQAVVLRAGDDWRTGAPTHVEYSTQLSAVMALEVRARLEDEPRTA